MPEADRIFINYRRADTRWAASRLYDGLSRRVGPDELFMDVDSIPPGADFVEYLNAYVDRSKAIVVLIGPHWLDLRDENGLRRIEDPTDFVNIEISRALERNVTAIPVLVDGADMPSEAELPPGLAGLARRQAIRLGHETYGQDLRRLLDALDCKPIGSKSVPPRSRIRSAIMIAGFSVSLALFGVGMLPHGGNSSVPAGAIPAITLKAPAGTWSSDYGDMVWTEAGAQYAGGKGRIVGSFEGEVFQGYWAEEQSKKPCDTQRAGTNAWGRIALSFDARSEFFHGQWGYCDAEPSIPWTGMRN